MKKRWRLWIFLFLFSGIGLTWFFWPEDRIGPANYRRIQVGMKQEEIEAIIGLPPGDYYTGPRGVGGLMSRGPFGFLRREKGLSVDNVCVGQIPDGFTARSWEGNHYSIQVLFNAERDAVGVYLWKIRPAVDPPSLLERFRNWLGW
jgi:hypothetical protein